MLELKIFVCHCLHTGVLLSSLFIHTTEQFFKIFLGVVRDLSKQGEDTPAFLLASFMPMNAQQVPRASYEQFPSRPILVQPSPTHTDQLTWNFCSWTLHLDSLRGLGCGNRDCSCYRRCRVTMAVFLLMALPCLGSDLEYWNTKYKLLGVFSNAASVNINSMMSWLSTEGMW